jgi:hypothetical protein
MVRLPGLALAAIALLALSACATISGSPTQAISIAAVDADGRPVRGMNCRLANSKADYFGSTPMFDVQVLRSGSDLEIECRRGTQVARATAYARSAALGGALLLPGGGAAALIDRLSGYAYAYPRTMQLRVGTYLTFDDGAPTTAADTTALAAR